MAKSNMREAIADLDLSKITPSGLKWLRASLDPFHDYQLDLAGYPDASAASTYVQMFTATKEISAPASAAGNWDCVIANLPRHSASSTNGSAYTVTSEIFGYESTPTKTIVLAPVVCHAADAGQPLWPNDTAALWLPTNWETNVLYSMPSDLNHHTSRIIAQGIEVHNTTAPMSVQGTVTVGKMAQNLAKEVAYVNDIDAAANMSGDVNLAIGAMPPAYVSEAIQYPNCEQWKAEDGVYQVCTLRDVSQPFQVAERRLLALHSSALRGAGTFGAIQEGTANATRAKPIEDNYLDSGMDTSFSFWSGLSNATTLTITVKTVVEYAPMYGSASLPTANPSAPYDPVALELYARVSRRLPVGVKVNYNDAGRWFRMILSAIQASAPKLGMLLEPVYPGASLVGNTVGVVAGGAKQLIKKKKKVNGANGKPKAKQTFTK